MLKISLSYLLCLLVLSSFAQDSSSDLRELEQFVGYYNVGVKPNRPFFKSRWYLREGKLYTIYDSDIDRELVPYREGAWAPTIFLSEEKVQVKDLDSTYYLVLSFEEDQLESFKVIRPRKIWPTDLYGYRIDQLDSLAVDTEEELAYSYQSEHFQFSYSTVDTAIVPQVALLLEAKFESLVRRFGKSDFPVTSIKMYPLLATYHNAVLTPGAPTWQMGRVWDTNEIRMLSTVVASEIRQENTDPYGMILHEFVHCLHLSMIPDSKDPVGWLWEGLANYLGCCQLTDNPFNLSYMKKGKYPSLKCIERDPTSEMKYTLGPFLVAYIEDTYGWDAVLDLIESNGDIEQSLKVSVKAFQEQFYGHLERLHK